MDFDGPAIRRDGFVQLFLGVQGIAKVVVGGLRVRASGDGSGVESDRPVKVLSFQ